MRATALWSGYGARQRESPRSQSQQDRVRRQAGPPPGLLLGLPAPHLTATAARSRTRTVANISALPDHVIDLIDAGLKGQQLVPAGDAVTITGSLPHGPRRRGARKWPPGWGCPPCLGPRRAAAGPGPGPDHLPGWYGPGSKLSTLTWWADTHPRRRPRHRRGQQPMTSTRRWTGWPASRDSIETQLAARHLAPAANPGRQALFDLSSLLDGGTPLPACPPRGVLPGRQERPACRSSTGCSPDPDGRPGRGPGLPPAIPATPHRIHPDRRGRPDQVRAGRDGHGRRPRHDHQRPGSPP